MIDRIRLIPFRVVESLTKNVQEIPKGIRMIKAPEVWKIGHKGAGVVIAVLDSGCQINHPDLKDQIIGGKNFTNEGSPEDYSDKNGHGTHVCGTIAAATNGAGVTGVAPEAKLLILKVLDGEGSGKLGNIIEAIQYAIGWRGPNQEKVRVLSMSLGSRRDDPRVHQVIKRAAENQILVVCASGNEGGIESGGDCSDLGDEYSYPGAYPEVVEVGAVDLNEKIPCFSNTNAELDLVAPGVNILSTYPQDLDSKKGYAVLTGTSMSTPHVAGAAALVINQCEKEFGRTLTEPEVYAQLCKRTFPLGYSKKIEGNGLLRLMDRNFKK